MRRRLLASALYLTLTCTWWQAWALPAKAEINGSTIVLLIDTSGSMKRMEREVRTALTTFIDTMCAGWQVIFVRFDVFSEVLVRTSITSQTAREHLRQQVETLRFVGKKTNFDEGLKGAQAALFQARAVEHAAIVIVSDGLSDPSHTKETLGLTALAQQLFPPQDGYRVYFLQIVPGTAPDLHVATQQGNVTSMTLSQDNVHEIVTVIEAHMADAKAALSEPQVPVLDVPSPLPLPPPLDPIKPSTKTFLPDVAFGHMGLYIILPLLLVLGGVCMRHSAMGHLLRWRQPKKAVRLQRIGQSSTLREFWLGPGEELRIGHGICDYPLSTASAALLARQKHNLVIYPADINSDIALSGQRIESHTLLGRRSTVVLDGHIYLDIELA